MSDGWRDDRDWPPAGTTARKLWELDAEEVETFFEGGDEQ